MKILQQPSNRSCGQTCVAMATGIPLDTVFDIFGHRISTTTKELTRALNHLGYKPKVIYNIKNKPVSALPKSIIAVKNSDHWHWVLYNKSKFYDPYYAEDYSIKEFKVLYNNWHLAFAITL